jgi:hypothetical protein
MNQSGPEVWFTQVEPVIVGSVALGVGLFIGCVARLVRGQEQERDPLIFRPELRPAASRGSGSLALLGRRERHTDPLTVQADPCVA